MMNGIVEGRSSDGASIDMASGLADEPAFGPPAERWAPVGAACSSPDVVLPVSMVPGGREVYGMPSRPAVLDLFAAWPPGAQLSRQSPSVDVDTVRRLEEEREQLDSSLLALTAHFAHVQLRLHQVASCPDPALKDTMLKELEEFASNGVPDVSVLLPKPCDTSFVGGNRHGPGLVESQQQQQLQQLQQEAKSNGSIPPSSSPSSAALAMAAASAAAVTAADEKLRERQRAALEQLRSQLSELEAYAYEVGVADDVPTTTRVEKQNVIIEELQKKLHLSELENLATLSPEQLRAIVDAAIAEIVNPAKVKEKVVEQLKTQVTDLERFVQFLQTEIDGLPKPLTCGDCTCRQSPTKQAADGAGSGTRRDEERDGSSVTAARLVGRSVRADILRRSEKPATGRGMSGSVGAAGEASGAAAASRDEAVKSDEGHDRRLSLLKRLLLVLQAFVISELGCGSGADGLDKHQSSLGDKHWGNLRARMEMIVDDLLLLLSSQKEHWKGRARHGAPLAVALSADDDYVSDDDVGSSEDNDDDDVFSSVRLNQDITQLVRKQLAPALQRLLEHGLREESSADQGVVLWSFANCFSSRSRTAAAVARASGAHANNAAERRRLHAWDIVMQYYELKHGREYTESPACKLSTSFGLPVGDGRPTTVRQSLLRAVGDIVASHAPYRRSPDAHFKAFVCRALNEKQLTAWLRLVVKSAVASDRYAQHSYVRQIGFEDALSTLDRLTQHGFNLPVDLAVSRLSSVVDAF